jgi:hypothetical protein
MPVRQKSGPQQNAETQAMSVRQIMTLPPFTSSTWPVIQDNASEAKNSASSGDVRWRSDAAKGQGLGGFRLNVADMNLSVFSLCPIEGAMALARMPKVRVPGRDVARA